MPKQPKNPARRCSDHEGTVYEVPRSYKLADGTIRTKTYWCAELRWKEDPDDRKPRPLCVYDG